GGCSGRSWWGRTSPSRAWGEGRRGRGRSGGERANARDRPRRIPVLTRSRVGALARSPRPPLDLRRPPARAVAVGSSHRREDVVRDVGVGVDLLDVVVVLEGLDEVQDLLRVLARDGDVLLRDLGDLRVADGEGGGL